MYMPILLLASGFAAAEVSLGPGPAIVSSVASPASGSATPLSGVTPGGPASTAGPPSSAPAPSGSGQSSLRPNIPTPPVLPSSLLTVTAATGTVVPPPSGHPVMPSISGLPMGPGPKVNGTGMPPLGPGPKANGTGVPTMGPGPAMNGTGLPSGAPGASGSAASGSGASATRSGGSTAISSGAAGSVMVNDWALVGLLPAALAVLGL